MPAVAFGIHFEHSIVVTLVYYFGYRNGGMTFVAAFIMMKEGVK
jgi:hypothetical protein